MNSIRSRLLLWQISALLVTALVASAVTYHFAYRGFNQVQDDGLEQIAHTVLRHDETPVPASGQRPSDADPSDTIAEPAEDEPDEGRFISQVWSAKGELIYASVLDDGPPLQAPGFHSVEWGGHSWRVYTLPRETRTAQVAVARRDSNRNFSSLLPWMFLPLALLVVLLGLLIHQAVNRALQPLEQLRHDIGQRDVAELHAVALQGLPEELTPLARTLNQLLERLDQLLAGQRRFLADAAHELNTPLAALKLQALLARRADDTQRNAALDDLDAGIERAIHLTAQLLALARLEPDQRPPAFEPLALDSLVRRELSAFSPQAERRQIDLGLVYADAVSVDGDHAALRAMVDNLIDNALRYSPPGARVDVSLHREGGQAVLAVADNGPGIAPPDRERATERFVRLQPSGEPGSGLGLAIAFETAQLHGGSLALEDTPGGGLTVRVRLPLPATM